MAFPSPAVAVPEVRVLTAAELAAAQRELSIIEAELARRASLKLSRYFHDCLPGCNPDSLDVADHVPLPGRTRPSCRVLYRKHTSCFRAGATFRQRMFLAGNRTGKTDAAAFECSLHLTGEYPDWWEGRRFSEPVEIWASGDTTTTTRDIIQQALLGPLSAVDTKLWDGMIPAHRVLDTSRKHGVPDSIETITVQHVSGGVSSISLKSYDQGRRAFQGTAKALIWLDEEPDDGVYDECLIRTMTTGGLILTTLTPLAGLTQFVDHFLERSVLEVVNADGTSELRQAKSAVFENDASETDERAAPSVEGLSRHVVMAEWDDCPHLDDDAKRELASEYLPYQIEARRRGIPSLGSGAIYPIPESEIRVKTFEIPPHWPRAYALDTGWKWTGAVFATRDPETMVVYIYDCYKRASAEAPIHADAIRSRGGDWMYGVGDAAGINNNDGLQFLEIYQRLGLNLMLADKAVEAGIQDTWQMLSAGKLKVMDCCGVWFDEFRLYRRDEKGKIVKKDDHLMDPTRYMVRSGLDQMTTKPPPRKPSEPPVLRGSWMGVWLLLAVAAPLVLG